MLRKKQDWDGSRLDLKQRAGSKKALRRRPAQLGDLIGPAIKPACRKRGFASVDILALWPEIVGARYADRVRPIRLIWPRQSSQDSLNPSETPSATLLVHTDGPTALLLSHETSAIISRINTFFGWAAIGRIKIIQKPVPQKPVRPAADPRPLTEAEERRLDDQLGTVENDRLRQALKKLGTLVIARGEDA